MDRLLTLTVEARPEGEPLYEQDMVTDQPMRTLAAEIVREKILDHTTQEVPHSVAVEVERFVEEGKLAKITASILVEKESQKAIVIGKHGDRLKAIGTAARREMERLFGVKVYLQLWVRVRQAWRQDEQVLAELGY
jgi:GTP-binding protein Era